MAHPPLDRFTPDWLFAQQCTFMFGSQSPDDLPRGTLPEVAFVGRSNVGKSSLINLLTGRRALARASNTPGRTRQINFFELGPERAGYLRLVDLPGYGYAKMSKTDHARWERLMLSYLVDRAALRVVMLLVDGRHGFKELDRMMMGMLDVHAVPYRVVLTKHDKMGPKAETEALVFSIRSQLQNHPAAIPEPLLTSATTRYGQDEIRASIAALLTPEGDSE